MAGSTMLVPTCFWVPARQAYIVLMSRSCPVIMSRAVDRALVEMDMLAAVDDASGVIEVDQQRLAIGRAFRARRYAPPLPRCRNRPCCPRAPCHASGSRPCSTKFARAASARVSSTSARRNAQAALVVHDSSRAPSWPRRRRGWPGRGRSFPGAASAASMDALHVARRSVACTARPPCRGGRPPPPSGSARARMRAAGIAAAAAARKGLRQHSCCNPPACCA